MKHLFATLLLYVGTLFSACSQTVGGLTLYTQDGERFRATCNGNPINAQPATRVKVRELDTDVVRVKITFEKPALGTIEKTLYLRMGDEERHVIKRRGERSGTEAAGAKLEEKLLGALGGNSKEKGNSPYTIVFNNAVPYVPEVETVVETEGTTSVSANGHTVKTQAKMKVRQRVR